MDATDHLDEGRHVPGPEPLWAESWYLDFWNDDASLGGYIRLGMYPNLGVSWYWACLVGEGRPLVTVVDNDAPLPKDPTLVLRAPGLWTDIIVETPLQHVTVALEAFGVALDDPTEMYRRGWGRREALGFDLEWETEGTPFAYAATTRYEVPCRVHGEILVGQERIDFDGWGQRDHSWGVRDWWVDRWCWSAGRLSDGRPFHSTILEDRGWSTGFVGSSADIVDSAEVSCVLDADGLLQSGQLRLDDLQLEVDPVAWSPILLTAPDGRSSRLARALVRYSTRGGPLGVGWVEFNQPQ